MSVASAAVASALAQVGKPYKWGASGPDAFDCSGLVYHAYKNAGLPFPRTTAALLAHLPFARSVSLSALEPGDLIFYGNPIHHVAIYTGNGRIVHAPHTGSNVSTGTVAGPGTPVSAVRLSAGVAAAEGGGLALLVLLGGAVLAYRKGWI
jgi:cell wall-associated NlpC family hydrolase